jgi:hypothetical protein
MSYFGVSTRNGVGLGLGTVPSLTNTPLGYRLAPSLDLSFAGSDALSPAITFSRTTNATLTNSSGLIANAPMNLLTFSEQFDASAWGKTASTVSANTVVAPNGTTTADSFLETATTDYHSISTSPTMALSTKYTFSIYAKPNGRNWLVMNIYTGTASTRTWFDVSNGVIGTVGAGATAVISSAGNGWYRCSITVDTASSGSPNLAIWTATADNNFLHAGDITKGLYIWGAQLELGSTATTYNPTTVKNLLGFTENFDNAAWTKSNAFMQTNLLTYSQDFDNVSAWPLGSNTAVTANQITAPDGSMTADMVTTTSTTNSLRTIDITVAASTTYTFSVYVQRGTATDLFWSVYNTSGASDILAPTSFFSQTTASGWTRCTLTFTTPVGCTAVRVFPLRGSGVGTVYFWGAQLVQGATPGDYKATYAAAAAVGYTDIYGQPFAQKLVENTATSIHSLIQPITPITSTPYTGTLYVKAAERAFAFVGIGQTGNNSFASINLSTGAVSVAFGSPTVSATSIGNGWFRVSVTVASISTASLSLEARVSTDGVWDNRSYTGDGTSGIYIFGAQLSDSASVDPYVYQPVAAPTSTAYYGPRFDYDPVTLAPKGLLIEEQRTNLLTYSEQLDNAAWLKASASVTATNVNAPNGTLTADQVTITGSGFFLQQVTVVPGTTYTVSFYALAGTSPTVNYFIYNVTAASTLVSVVNYVPLLNSSTWTRVSFSFTVPAGCTSIYVDLARSSSNGTVNIWGAQLEAGAFATSYIPTVASQVTRAADSASMIGNNFARWYTQGAGTLYADSTQALTTANTFALFSTGVNIIRLGNGKMDVFVAGTPSAQITGTVTSGSIKQAGAYQVNDFAISTNGGAVSTDTSGAVPFVDSATFSSAVGNSVNGTIKRIAYYNRRLSNTELQGLTS